MPIGFGPADRHNLQLVLNNLFTINGRLELMSQALDDLNAKLAAIGTSLDGISADILALKDQIGQGMSASEVAQVQASLQSLADRTAAIDASTP